MGQEVGRALDGIAPTAMPQRIGLLEQEFTVERGELTPKMSVRRRVVDEAYAALIEELYAGG